MAPAAWIGLVIMIGSQVGTFARVEPFWSWNTPISWTGFILFADAIVFRATGRSWMRTSPGEFVVLALASIPLWLVFEFYNRFLDNWYYVGLPENLALRYVGYAWSFATIWPAIFEGADLVSVWRGSVTVPAGPAPPALPVHPAHPALPALPAPSAVFVAAGALMLASPFVVSPAVARYLAAPVWLGFIFLLDPINARMGGASLLDEARLGRYDRLINLSSSGLLCGFLWEFWNYWSRSKWHYTVPIMEHVKLFEMPLPGFLGFPFFALECFTMWVFVRTAGGNLGRKTTL